AKGEHGLVHGGNVAGGADGHHQVVVVAVQGGQGGDAHVAHRGVEERADLPLADGDHWSSPPFSVSLGTSARSSSRSAGSWSISFSWCRAASELVSCRNRSSRVRSVFFRAIMGQP